MALTYKESEFLDLFESNKIESAFEYLESNDVLFLSTQNVIITSIMTLLLICGAYEDCIIFGDSKKNECDDEDYYYNMGVAYNNLEKYEEACVYFMYSYLTSTNSQLELECESLIFALVDNFKYNKCQHIAMFFNEVNRETLKYYVRNAPYSTMCLNGDLIYNRLKDGNVDKIPLVEYVIYSCEFLLIDIENEYLRLQNIFTVKTTSTKLIYFKTILDLRYSHNVSKECFVPLSELVQSFDDQYVSKSSVGLLERVVFDYDFETLESEFEMNYNNFGDYLKIREFVLAKEYDLVLKTIDKLAGNGRMNGVFLFPLIYIYKMKNDYSYCLYYLNQIVKNGLINDQSRIIEMNSLIIQRIRDCDYISDSLDDYVFENELRSAYKSNLLDIDSLREVVKRILPKSLIIESFRGCNLKCPLCVIQGYNNFDNAMKSISPEIVDKLIGEVDIFNNLRKLYLHNLGEPLLNANITELIIKIKKKYPKLYITLDSNLSLRFDIEAFVLSGLDEVVVAVDGYDQDSYSRYRVNGKFGLLEENIRNISEAKRRFSTHKPNVIAKSVLFKHLEENKNQLQAKIKTLVVDQYAIQAPLVFHPEDKRYNYENYSEWINIDAEYSRYKLNDKSKMLEMKNKRTHICNGILSTLAPTINYDGNVFPCCVIGIDNQYSFGNVSEVSFMEIWQSERYVDFRINKMIGNNEDAFCKYCSMG